MRSHSVRSHWMYQYCVLIFGLMMVQWTETCRRIFNTDCQYMLCYWLNKLLYYCKTQWHDSYQGLNNFILWKSPINSVPYTDKLQHFLWRLTVTLDCSSITAARWCDKSHCLWINLSLIWRPHNSERSTIPKLTIFVTSRLPSVNPSQRHGPQQSTPSAVIRTHTPRTITHIRPVILQCLNMLSSCPLLYTTRWSLFWTWLCKWYHTTSNTPSDCHVLAFFYMT
jgi:hypothetical protein